MKVLHAGRKVSIEAGGVGAVVTKTLILDDQCPSVRLRISTVASRMIVRPLGVDAFCFAICTHIDLTFLTSYHVEFGFCTSQQTPFRKHICRRFKASF